MNSQPAGNVITWVPTEISPGALSFIVGPLNVVYIPPPPGADVLSIEIFVPPLAGVTVAANAKLGAKKPLTINVAATNTKTDVLTFLKRERERERGNLAH